MINACSTCLLLNTLEFYCLRWNCCLLCVCKTEKWIFDTYSTHDDKLCKLSDVVKKSLDQEENYFQ